MSVRLAGSSDRGDCLRLMRAFHDELGQGLFPAEVAYGVALFDRFTTAADHAAFVWESEGVRGLLFAQAGWHDLSPIRVASERLWYVEPSCRARAWRPMLSAFEAWAVDRGCDRLAMVALDGNAAVGRLYQRSGYVAVETHYMKKV